jgi:hypothetical protein
MRSAVISSLRAQEATLVDQVSQLGTELGPRHPSLIAAQQQLRDTRQLIARELGRIATATETDYERALANQQALEAKVAGMKSKSLDTDQASVRLRELQRDLEALRRLLELSPARPGDARADQCRQHQCAHHLQRHARLEEELAAFAAAAAGAIGGGLGLGTGLALIARICLADGAFQRPDAVGHRAPVLGVVPAKSRHWPALVAFRRGAAAASSQKTDAVVGLALRRMFSSGQRPPDWPLVPSILVTSSPGEGAQRSGWRGLLANAAASRGSRVLFIDANAGGGQKDPQPGILDVLRGEYAFEAVSHYAAGSNVAVLGRGRSKAVFQEAHGIYFAQQMLARASRSFELVVIDGGALADNLNASPLVAMADEIVLVATLNATPMRDVTTTIAGHRHGAAADSRLAGRRGRLIWRQHGAQALRTMVPPHPAPAPIGRCADALRTDRGGGGAVQRLGRHAVAGRLQL